MNEPLLRKAPAAAPDDEPWEALLDLELYAGRGAETEDYLIWLAPGLLDRCETRWVRLWSAAPLERR